MAKKQLTVNMIYGGSFHREGSVLDEEEIPLNLRKAKYLKEPPWEQVQEYDEEIVTDEIFEQEMSGETEEEMEEMEAEEPPPPPSPRRKKR